VRCSALLLALILQLFLVACGSSHTTSANTEAAAVRSALEARLLRKKLSYRWVVCVRTRRSFAGSPIFRCNVNFGEPHIVRYCATLEDGQLITDREQAKLRCGRETAP